MFNDHFISYTHFIQVDDINANPAAYRNLVEQSTLRWKPDFGTWPQGVTQAVFRSPYQDIDNGYYDDGLGFATWGGVLQQLGNNDYIGFYTMDFQNGPVSFSAVTSAPAASGGAGGGGSIELHLESTTGPLVGNCPVGVTGSWDTKKTVQCNTTAFGGLHDLFLVFKGTGYDMFHLHSFKFTQGARSNQTITFPTVPAKTVGDGDFAPGASSSSGLAIGYTSSNPAVAAIVGGKIHLVGAGTTTITAAQPGSAAFNPAVSVDRSLNVAVQPRAPYSGTAMAIPGTIEAENYDKGGEGVAYHDSDATNIGGLYRIDAVDIDSTATGFAVAWTSTGEWLEYSINVANAGGYDFEFWTSSPFAGGEIGFALNGGNIQSRVVPKTTGWKSFVPVAFPVILAKGQQVLRVNIVKPGFNLDRIMVKTGTSGRRHADPTSEPVNPSSPSAANLLKLSRSVPWKVYSTSGIELANGQGDQIDLRGNPAGVYLVKLRQTAFRVVLQN